MKPPIRYAIYFSIGMLLYFVIGADENPDALEEVHSLAPALIIGLVVLLMVVKYIRHRQEKDQEK